MYINIFLKNKFERGDNFFIVGLKDFFFSVNLGIFQKFWVKFGIFVVVNSCLREFYLDYNSLGDYVVSCIVVGFFGFQNFRVLDLESINIGDFIVEVCVFQIQNFEVLRFREFYYDIVCCIVFQIVVVQIEFFQIIIGSYRYFKFCLRFLRNFWISIKREVF